MFSLQKNLHRTHKIPEGQEMLLIMNTLMKRGAELA